MGAPGAERNVQQLVEEHYRSLYRYAFRLCGREADAEDLTQETFCQAQLKLAQLRDWQKARGWLFTILRNAYLRRLRSQKGEHLLPLVDLGEVPDRLPEIWPEVDAAQLQQALNELPEGFRTPLLLYYFEEFSYRDIADQMDLPVGTVMSRLARAKGYLRGRLMPKAPEVKAVPRRETGGM